MKKILILISISLMLLIFSSSGFTGATKELTLEKAIKTAIANNSEIKVADYNLKSAVSEKNKARGDMFFTASATWSYTDLGEEPFMYMDAGPAGRVKAPVADTDQYRWDITVVQPLFTGFALSSRYKMTKLGIKIKEFQKQQAILNLAKKVKKAYYNILLMQKIVQVADDAVKCLTSHKNDAEKLYKRGVIRYNDLLSARVALSDVVQKREKAIAGSKMTTSVLNMLLCRDINNGITIKAIDKTEPLKSSLEELTAEAMKKRPALKAIEFGIKTLEKAIILARSACYPEVAFIGSYEQNGDSLKADNNNFSNYHNSSVTLQAKWTFFQGGKARADISKHKHDKRALIEQLKIAQDGIKIEIKNVFLNLKVAGKNIETAKQSLGQAEENWRVTNLLYSRQVATSSEVLDARTFLTQADTNYYEALYSYMVSFAELQRATGRM